MTRHRNRITRGLVVAVCFLLLAITFQPSILAGIQEQRLTSDLDEKEVVCRIYTEEGIQEVLSTISDEDILELESLYGSNQRTFLERACQLGVFGDTSPTKLDRLISSDEESSMVGPGFQNEHCRFSFSGALLQTYYLPIPYFVYHRIATHGFPLIGMMIVLVLLFGLIFYGTPILEFILNVLDAIVNVLSFILEPVLRAIGQAVQKAISMAGWVHAWSPVKFPFRNTVITSGSLTVNATGDNGTWNHTGTVRLVMMGFRGVWISLPPTSLPPYSPTWCIGSARYLSVSDL